MSISLIIGIIVTLLGISFAYRCYRACVSGKINYWAGFLPLSIISLVLIHTPPPPSPVVGKKRPVNRDDPPPKRTLIREAQGLWVHFIMGPIYFAIAVLFIAAGCDLMGLPGIDTLNYLLNGGNKFAPVAITYDKRYHFQFPIFVRAMERFGKNINTVEIPLPADKKLLDDGYVQGNKGKTKLE